MEEQEELLGKKAAIHLLFIPLCFPPHRPRMEKASPLRDLPTPVQRLLCKKPASPHLGTVLKGVGAQKAAKGCRIPRVALKAGVRHSQQKAGRCRQGTVMFFCSWAAANRRGSAQRAYLIHPLPPALSPVPSRKGPTSSCRSKCTVAVQNTEHRRSSLAIAGAPFSGLLPFPAQKTGSFRQKPSPK